MDLTGSGKSVTRTGPPGGTNAGEVHAEVADPMADDSGEAAAAHEEIADAALAPTDFAPTADANDAKRQRTGDAAPVHSQTESPERARSDGASGIEEDDAQEQLPGQAVRLAAAEGRELERSADNSSGFEGVGRSGRGFMEVEEVVAGDATEAVRLAAAEGLELERSDSVTGFRGVGIAAGGRFKAMARASGSGPQVLGTFDSPEEARAYHHPPSPQLINQ
jgi:hypothetical protein